MHYRLLPKRMCSGSHGLLKICEITDNISKMVQDRDIVTVED